MHDGAKDACRKALRQLCDEWQIDESGDFSFPDEMPGQQAFLSAPMNKLSQWVRHTNLLHILIATLSTVVPRSQEEREGSSTRSLFEFLGQSKTDEFITSVIGALSCIPEAYVAYFELAAVNNLDFDECQLAPGVSIVRDDKVKDTSLSAPSKQTNSLRLLSGLAQLSIAQKLASGDAGAYPRRYFLAIEASGTICLTSTGLQAA